MNADKPTARCALCGKLGDISFDVEPDADDVGVVDSAAGEKMMMCGTCQQRDRPTRAIII